MYQVVFVYGESGGGREKIEVVGVSVLVLS